MAVIIFSLVGIIAGSLCSIIIAYLIHLILQIPNITRASDNISELIGLFHTLVIVGLFESFKFTNKSIFKNKLAHKITILGAFIISLLASISSIYSTTEIELHFAKKGLVENGKVAKYEQANRVVEEYISKKTNDSDFTAHLKYSIQKHPIFLFVVFVSCFISVWTTMPMGLRKIINIAGEIGLIEK
ncbi:MAG: hypothetical protein QMD44_10910 [Thermodesulfovibrionales bacterium]|jgi:hypothetical protein|nr:hypothetical protein [Thermodesulfovibrionales bacterium]